MDIRVRPDVINYVSGYISDVKTCQDASPDAFRRDVFKWGYHLQAAFYMDMTGVETFKFVCVEVNHPYTVVVHTLNEEFIDLGRKKYQQALSDWKNYLRTKEVKLYHSDTICEDGSYLICK